MYEGARTPVKSSTKLTYNMRCAGTVLREYVGYTVSQSDTYAHIRAQINAYKAVCSNIYEDKAKATCERRIKLQKLPKCESETRG